ncbi:DUF998 domain-containing protein [Virgisporangium aliadipatigenens]|uniref:DUF998 domain-containing protein n=1 Tax=Virgisporangium aliadipatigenens TaxID=741659 RepID=UPI003570BC26
MPAVYRSGILLIAAALVLLAAAVRQTETEPGSSRLFRSLTARIAWAGQGMANLERNAWRLAVLCLIVAAPFGAASGAVTCSPGCPLPPYEAATPGDLVHGAASIGALFFAGLAMIMFWLAPESGRRLRLASATGAISTVPLLVAVAIAMLFLGRGWTSGVLERAAVVAALSWLVAASSTAMRRRT